MALDTLSRLDLLVLLKLAASPAADHRDPPASPETIRDIAAALEVSKTLVGRSVQRLRAQSLVVEEGDRRRLNRIMLRELFVHGVRWIAPARLGKVVLGMPTAHAASPLAERLPGDPDPVVIPLEEGPMRGRSVTPIHPCAGKAASKDRKLHELLAIVDGIRIGNAREREVATTELRARL